MKGEGWSGHNIGVACCHDVSAIIAKLFDSSMKLEIVVSLTMRVTPLPARLSASSLVSLLSL